MAEEKKEELTLKESLNKLYALKEEREKRKSPKQKKSVHHNHRQRVDKKVEEYGFENLPDHEKLEYILYVTIPRCDTNALAYSLLGEFGTLQGVFSAKAKELKRVKGIGYRTAHFLSQLNDVAGVIVRSQKDSNVIFNDTKKAKEYIQSYYLGRLTENSYMFMLDANRRLKNTVKISEGVNNHSYIYPQKVAQKALLNDAHSVVIAHNHPGGSVEPSTDDIEVTKKIEITLNAVGIQLYDSVIISDDNYFSFRENGYVVSLKWIN